MKKIWITGAGGHIGTALKSLLDCNKYNILCTDHNDVDITNKDKVYTYALNNRPEVIINCAGVTDLTLCAEDPEAAYAVNAVGPRNLAMAANSISAKLIQLSTDDVFSDHIAHKFNEFDPVHPKTMYGKSKWAGERIVANLMKNYVIIRSSWVYGTGNDFVEYILNTASQQSSLEVPTNMLASPTSADELAKIITQFIDGEYYGTYHAVCKGHCTRYKFAQEILKCAGIENKLSLIPIEVPDGAYSVLDNMMLRIDRLEEPCEWKQALKNYFDLSGGKPQ